MKSLIIALSTVSLLALGSTMSGQPKEKASGTLTLDNQTFKFTSVLAYENTVRNNKETVIILSEKPLDTAKLKESFKKNGNDDDFYPTATHVKLTFDERDRGELSQLTIQSDGGVIIRSGDKNITATATIKDDAVKGKAGMLKPDKTGKKNFTLEASFDVKMWKP